MNTSLNTFKNDYLVNIRPVDAPEGAVDQLVVGAFDADQARDNIQKMLDRGVRSLAGPVEYMIESVYTPGSDEYATLHVDSNRPTVYIGSSYVV
jgi:hypothetical protein